MQQSEAAITWTCLDDGSGRNIYYLGSDGRVSCIYYNWFMEMNRNSCPEKSPRAT